MELIQKMLGKKILSYSLVLLGATGLSVVAYSYPLLNWLFKEIATKIVTSQQSWISYHHSFFAWVTSGIYLLAICIGGLISPFVLVIVITLQLFKPDWLPEDDVHLLKALNYWCDLCLLVFAVTLLSTAMKTGG